MRQIVCAGIIAAAALAWGAEGSNSDQDLIQGSWERVSFERSGKEEKNALGTIEKYVGSKVFWIDKNDPCCECEFEVTLRPDKMPKEIDFTHKPDEDIEPGRETMKGIYRLEGDDLTICCGNGGGERATEFKTAESQKYWLMKLKRIKQN